MPKSCQYHQSRAEEALEDLALWPVERLPPQHLLGAAWSHRHNLNAFDACYVARVHDATLLTADGPLARAQSLGCVVHNVRLS